MGKDKKNEVVETSILRIEQQEMTAYLLGETGLICNRVSEKAKHELLFPSGRKNEAEKKTTLKHDPMAEFRAAPHCDRDPNGPTFIQLPVQCFKGAIASAALDLPGTSKASIGRMVWVKGARVAIYGVPQLLMSVVRSADMNRTPDIRTRAILPRWAAKITITFPVPLIKPPSVANLLAGGGFLIGVGDWRAEKGKGNYGSFKMVDPNDQEWNQIVKTGGRAVQVAAMEHPDFYDEETEEMFRFWTAKYKQWGTEPAKTNGKKKAEIEAEENAS